MDIDWDAKWKERLEKSSFSIMNVKCANCGVTRCKCAKKEWIEHEKDKLGLPCKKMFLCDVCGNKKTFVYRNEEKSICETCTKLKALKISF